MRRKKSFKLTPGHYFFNIKAGYQNSIIISRKTKKDAMYAFANYLTQRKEAEWLGQWDGKNFIDNEYQEAA